MSSDSLKRQTAGVWTAVLLVPFMMVTCLGACGNNPQESSSATSPPSRVSSGVLRLTSEELSRTSIEVTAVGRGGFRLSREFPATIRPNENELAEVTTLIRGRVVNVQVDVGAFAHVSRHDAADEARAKAAELPHEAKCVQAHVAQVLGALFALVHAGKELDQVADFGIALEAGESHAALGIQRAGTPGFDDCADVADPKRDLCAAGKIVALMLERLVPESDEPARLPEIAARLQDGEDITARDVLAMLETA